MPRHKPLIFNLTPQQKAFAYGLFKRLSGIFTYGSQGRDLVKLALKFPPGTTPVYLQVWERKVIVSWLMKLHKLAENRETDLRDKLRSLLEVLK